MTADLNNLSVNESVHHQFDNNYIQKIQEPVTTINNQNSEDNEAEENLVRELKANKLQTV